MPARYPATSRVKPESSAPIRDVRDVRSRAFPPRRLRHPRLPRCRRRRLAVRRLARHARHARHRGLRRRAAARCSASSTSRRRRGRRGRARRRGQVDARRRARRPAAGPVSRRPRPPPPAPSTTGATPTNPAIEHRERERRASQYIRGPSPSRLAACFSPPPVSASCARGDAAGRDRVRVLASSPRRCVFAALDAEPAVGAAAGARRSRSTCSRWRPSAGGRSRLQRSTASMLAVRGARARSPAWWSCARCPRWRCRSR